MNFVITEQQHSELCRMAEQLDFAMDLATAESEITVTAGGLCAFLAGIRDPLKAIVRSAQFIRNEAPVSKTRRAGAAKEQSNGQ